MSILTLAQGTEILEMLLPVIRSNFENDGVLVPTMMVMAEKDVETKKPLQRPSLMVSLMPQLPPETIRQILQKTVADLDVSMMILAVQAMSVGHLPLEEAKRGVAYAKEHGNLKDFQGAKEILAVLYEHVLGSTRTLEAEIVRKTVTMSVGEFKETDNPRHILGRYRGVVTGCRSFVN